MLWCHEVLVQGANWSGVLRHKITPSSDSLQWWKCTHTIHDTAAYLHMCGLPTPRPAQLLIWLPLSPLTAAHLGLWALSHQSTHQFPIYHLMSTFVCTGRNRCVQCPFCCLLYCKALCNLHTDLCIAHAAYVEYLRHIKEYCAYVCIMYIPPLPGLCICSTATSFLRRKNCTSKSTSGATQAWF